MPRRPTKARKYQTKILIGGQWRDSVSGKSFKTIDPSTEEVITEIAMGDAADIDLAVKARGRRSTTARALGARWTPAIAAA